MVRKPHLQSAFQRNPIFIKKWQIKYSHSKLFNTLDNQGEQSDMPLHIVDLGNVNMDL